ncbi:MAG: hypothetical protein AMXMBFR33_70690 [Candidatus Xenobia bacterium]
MRKLIVLASLVLLTALVQAQTAPATPAQAALDKMLKAYVDIKSGIISMDIKVLHPDYAGSQQTELRLLRPKKLWWHGKFKPEKAGSAPFDVFVISDGKEVYVFDSKTPAEYRQGKMPDPIRAIDLADYFSMGMSNMFLRAMTGMPERVLGSRTLELKEKDGAQVLLFKQGESTDELTLDPATHRVVKVANFEGDKLMAEGTVSYARMGEELEDAQFTFTPPAGAQMKKLEAEDG